MRLCKELGDSTPLLDTGAGNISARKGETLGIGGVAAEALKVIGALWLGKWQSLEPLPRNTTS